MKNMVKNLNHGLHGWARMGQPNHHPCSSVSSVVDLRGFSLLELLITMALILVMYFMLMSPRSKTFQDKQKLACEKNLRTIHMALKVYALDNKGSFPVVANATTSEAPLSLLIPKCTTVTEIFICPGSGRDALPQGEPFVNRRISYAYYMFRHESDGAEQLLLSDAQVNTLAKVRGAPVFSSDGKPPGANHNKFGGNLLYCDGHVEFSGAAATNDMPCPGGIVLLNPKP